MEVGLSKREINDYDMKGKVSKNQIKTTRALHQIKYRDLTGTFLVEGVKMVGEALSTGAKIEMIAFSGDPAEFPYALPVDALTAIRADLERMSAMKTAPPILAICRQPTVGEAFRPTSTFFALDGVKDPGNLGTVLRICDWFGIESLLCSPDCVDVFNPKVVQASMGAIFRVKVTYGDLLPVAESFQGEFSLLVADMDGESIHRLEWPDKSMVVFGSESHGPSPEIREKADIVFTIPGGGRGESLNVGVAAGITASHLAAAQRIGK